MALNWMEQVQGWDDRLFTRVFSGAERKRARRKFFYALSRSADGPWFVLLTFVWLFLKPAEAWLLVEAGALAFTLELSLYYLIKKNIGRPRPFQRIKGVRFLIAPPDEFSFPSGHTAAAFLVATLAAVSFPFPLITVAVLGWAGLVGFSRIYLGVHYPTDVLAGMVLGIASASLGLWIVGI
ncbi:MAG TPA: phosphatase PAP2 family protein [bacterium]